MIPVTMDADGVCDWSGLEPFRAEVRDIVGAFSSVLPSAGAQIPIEECASLSPTLRAEAAAVAQLANLPEHDVIAANLFYDMASSRCACTAFAADSAEGPVHGHCLDWETGAELLRERSRLFRFRTARGEFVSVGWPGFLGVLMAIAPGRFALTLNAVWSSDPRKAAEPIGLTLRKAVATAPRYADLVANLAACDVECDFLALISGTAQGEMAVVERTPARSAVRRPSRGFVLATNHYKGLVAGSSVPGYRPTGDEPFGLGSHERYDSAVSRLEAQVPGTFEDCYRLLGEAPFAHELTIQRLAFRAADARILVGPIRVSGARPAQ